MASVKQQRPARSSRRSLSVGRPAKARRNLWPASSNNALPALHGGRSVSAGQSERCYGETRWRFFNPRASSHAWLHSVKAWSERCYGETRWRFFNPRASSHAWLHSVKAWSERCWVDGAGRREARAEQAGSRSLWASQATLLYWVDGAGRREARAEQAGSRSLWASQATLLYWVDGGGPARRTVSQRTVARGLRSGLGSHAVAGDRWTSPAHSQSTDSSQGASLRFGLARGRR